MQGTQRAHILIPEDLLREIDAIVGPRGRSAFLLETARQEVRRRKLLSFLEDDSPVWHEKDHADIGHNAADWVRKSRHASDRRIGKAPRQTVKSRA